MMIGNRDRLALISYFTTSLLGLQLSSTAASFSLWLKKTNSFVYGTLSFTKFTKLSSYTEN